ncbi:PREDICTED: FAR1-RELATED SEQUENCE, partial [Prunus dulcis]
STEEFDSKWMKIVEKSESQDNYWLRSLYEIRSSWVPAYVNHVFSTGMTSSQRVESCHAFFKRYVSKNNSLTDFITRLSRALVRQRHQELSADHIDKNEKPVLKLPLEMENQMAGTYTRKIFYEFQDELWCSLLYMVGLTSETANY